MLEIVHLGAASARDDARIVDKQCRALVARGHRVTLVVADGGGDAWRDGVRILDAGAAGAGIGALLAATRRLYRQALTLRPDIVQLHHPALLPAGLRLWRHGCKVVYDVGAEPPRFGAGTAWGTGAGAAWGSGAGTGMGAGAGAASDAGAADGAPPRRALAALWDRLERQACRRLDGVIAASPAARDALLPLNRATISVGDFPLPDECGAGLAWAERPLRVCHEDALSAPRGIVELVRACELLQSQVRLSLAGDFAEAALAARMLARPGWRRIDAPGRLGRSGAGALRASSRAGLITPHATPALLAAPPALLFDYMAAGIPVIASDFPQWRAVLDAHACGLGVDPRDPPAIAAAIDYLASHPDLARRMGENGRRAVRARYNWQHESHKLVEFYEHL